LREEQLRRKKLLYRGEGNASSYLDTKVSMR
jgi:hypothetical protein